MRMKAWFPDKDAGPFAGELRVHAAPGGDLARIPALEDRFPEQRYDWLPAAGREVRTTGTETAAREQVVMECAGCTGPRVVMNNDSFGENLAPLLAQRFRRTVLVEGSRLDRPLIERERPAIVIQEFVERALMCPDLRGC